MSSLTESPHGEWTGPAGLQATPVRGAFNEALNAEGHVRPAWQGLVHSIQRLGAEHFAIRVENGRRMLREQGVTYGATREPGMAERLWDLDFMPFVLSAEEWQRLSAGLVQRARLLNAVLHDLYSVQRLVRDGFIPAPLIYANPAYLRACQAMHVPGAAYLHSYAADLVRDPEGHWHVLADRTQAPVGLGFAQEGRSITARILPEALRTAQPSPLSESLRLRRDLFQWLLGRPTENPDVVLLTPGPANEAYFEDAYVARLLGLSLAEGADLSVRDRRVMLKNLNGLRPVDVVWRRVNDSFCDPLELRSDSLLGVPGLVEAARAGHVAVTNSLGSGLLESPGFLPYTESLCRHLLDEELKLPSIPTWWCGERRDREFVRQHNHRLALCSAFHLRPTGHKESEPLLAGQDFAGHEWVGQLPIRASQAPVFANGSWSTRACILRMFVLFDGNSYTAVPGGLARVIDGDCIGSVAMTMRGPSKDVWVLQPQPTDGPTIHTGAPALPPIVERSPADLPSRAADNFFWMGRYTERLEYRTRIARCVVNRLSDEAGPGSDTDFAALGHLLMRVELLKHPLSSAAVRESLQGEVLRLLTGEEDASSIRELCKRIRLGAFSLRHRLSADTWGLLMRIGTTAPPRLGPLPLVQAAGLLNGLILDLAGFSGMEMENITRGFGWAFLDLGRRLERALGVIRLIDAVVVHHEELELLFEPVLEIADSMMTYRWRYFALPRLDGLLDLLLTEPANPRSLAFQILRIEEHARALPTGIHPEGVRDVVDRVGRLVKSLQGLDPVTLSAAESNPETLAFLSTFAHGLSEMSEVLTHLFFSHVQPRPN